MKYATDVTAEKLQRAARQEKGATVFGYAVSDPERYGVVEFDADWRPVAIVEKPVSPRSNWAVTGLYFYDEQVADIAAKVDGAQPGMRGICLRGQPGWGQLFAPLTTVVNTFGGTWFDEDWTAKVNAPEFVEATKFYVDLVRDHGEPGAATSGFSECATQLAQGHTAMWYDATAAVSVLEDPASSKVVGKIGYVQAPVMATDHSGWLYTWSLGIPKTSEKQDAAWKFV